MSRVSWHMAHYTAPTPKPHYAYSNSPEIARLNKGKLTGWKRKGDEDTETPKVKTCDVYYNSKGESCWKGNRNLKKTEKLWLYIIFIFSWYFMIVFEWKQCSSYSYTFWYMWWCIITRKNIEELYILRFVCSDPIIWFFLLFSAFTSDINRPWLREYPVRFGMAMVDLYSDLIRTSQGMAPYPDPVPAAFDSFMAMRKTDSGLGFSGLGDVYRYLRGGRHLKLPRDWRPFVPKEAPLETETQNSWGFHLKSNDCGFVSKNMILNS